MCEATREMQELRHSCPPASPVDPFIWRPDILDGRIPPPPAGATDSRASEETACPLAPG